MVTLTPEALRRVIVGVDWGYTNPGVLQAWVIDGDDRMILVHEIYMSQKTIDWWIERAKELQHAYNPEAFVCDPAEPGYIQQFLAAGLPVVPGYNDVSVGIQAVEEQLRIRRDGRPGLMMYADCLDAMDPLLIEKKRPTSTREEFDSYVWPKGVDGKEIKEKPIKADDHGLDALRYVCAYINHLGAERTILPVAGGKRAVYTPSYGGYGR